ncbi:DNA polymerase zeta catalytic subunit-like protein [Tanacetum coccineum]
MTKLSKIRDNEMILISKIRDKINTDEEEVEPRRSKRARNEKSFGPDFVSFMVENEPTSYREAVTSSEGKQWREAIKSEIESILQNHTWELVDLPPGLVIKGFRQREGLDYFDTYSPVTRITSIRMVLAIATLRNLDVHQMDVKTAFLNGDLKEEIYMNQPEGFIAPGQQSKVCRLVKLSRYISNPSNAHWKAMARVLHYLRYSRDYGLHYDKYPAVIEGYNDANWISDIKDSRSTSGYVFTLGGAAISWKSSKQTVIAKSTMESEFIALDKCGEEAEWICQFVKDIPKWSKPVTTISIHCDSQSAIGRAHSIMYNGKSRHIHRRHNSIRQILSTGVISIDHVKSKDNIANPLTKGLSRELVSKSSKGMRLKPLKE